MQHELQQIAHVKRVSKSFGDKMALNSVSFDLYPGEVLSILGPNGAGKTTLIHTLLGRSRQTSGCIRVFGEEPGSIEAKRKSGVMLQVNSLPELKVKEHIQLFRCYYPNPLSYEHVLTMTGLNALEDRYSKALSGGEKQRLLFALAICGNPRLLFLDEPSVGMDIESRQALWQAIKQLKGTGTSVVLTTHHLEEADTLSDRVIMLNNGSIIKEGTPNELKSLVSCDKVSFESEADINDLNTLNSIVKTERLGSHFTIYSNNATSTVKHLLNTCSDVSNLRISGANLEDAFTHINDKAGELP